MGTTPVLVKELTQVNAADAAVGAGGSSSQFDGQVARLADGGYMVVWTDQSRTYNANGDIVVGQRYDSTGNRVGAEVPFNGFATGNPNSTAFAPAIAAFSNGDLVIAYTFRPAGFNERVFVEAPNGRTVIASPGFEPAVTTFADGSFVFAYTVGSDADTDIAWFHIDANGATRSSGFIHDEPDNSGNVELATLSNGNWVAVFQDEFNGSTTDIDIRFQIFTATGARVIPTGGALGVLVPGAGGVQGEIDPDVAALAGGGFVVVWTDADSTVTDIRAAILSDTGGQIRTNIVVNASQAGAQNEANVVGLLDGGFLVTWDDDDAGLVRAQRFDSVGNAVGDQFTLVEVEFGFIASTPELALLADGRIALALTRETLIIDDRDVLTSIWNPRGTVAAAGDVLWQQTDGTVATGIRELAQASNGWQIQGTGDFDADGDSDVLWRHQDGAVVTWELQNGQLLSTHNIAFATNGWEIVNTGDFDADGDSDVLWRHEQGAVVTWEMENGAYIQNHNIAFAATGWTIQGLGDFDDDGDTDIIWRHQEGAVVTWEMENGAYVQNHNIAFAATGWTIQGTGDFDADGDDDILWHHTGGAVVTWEMENGAYLQNHNIATAGGSWLIAGTVDFNGNGTDDILWRHGDGTVVIWQMSNGEFLQTDNFGVTGNDWQIRGTGEFDLL